MSIRLPNFLLRHTDGPPVPPLKPGADSPPLAPIPATVGAPALTVPSVSPAVQQAAVIASAQDSLQSTVYSLAALDPATPIAVIGQTLLAQTTGLDAVTLSVLQPVIQDLQLTAQNAADSGAGQITTTSTVNTDQVAEAVSFLETLGSSEVARLSTGLQNKISADSRQHRNTRAQNGVVNTDITQGYGTVLAAAIAAASSLASGIPRTMTQVSGESSHSPTGLAGTNAAAAYAALSAELIASHAVLAQEMQNERSYNTNLQTNLVTLSAAQSGPDGSASSAFALAQSYANKALSTSSASYLSYLTRPSLPPVVPVTSTQTITPPVYQDDTVSDQDTQIFDTPALPTSLLLDHGFLE